MDEIDRALLYEIQRDSKLTNAELAAKVGLSTPAVHARIKRLEDTGVICGYVALINKDVMGYDMLCFTQVTLESHEPKVTKAFREAVDAMPEVLECHQLIGDIDYLLKVVLMHKEDLRHFLMERLTTIPGVVKVKTSLVLEEIKSTTILPVEPPAVYQEEE
jgi:Lrp/AsnC family leucine-responsive transcriptional regulator